MTRVYVSAFAFALCSTGVAVAVPCPDSLNCTQGALCEEGHSDFSYHPQLGGSPLNFHIETIRDGAHCKCPGGLTGIECNHQFLSCEGDHTCYHGGRCIDGLRDAFGNMQSFCDCRDARDEDGSQYVGKFCERPVTKNCSQVHGSFCVNDGTCSAKYPRKGAPCMCSEGFEGPHCEFKTGTVPPCTLECGEGYCQLVSHFSKEASLENPESYLQCVCPEGFHGTSCEIPRKQHVMHHPSDICTVGDRRPGRPLSFCVNNGTCLLKVRIGEEHPGCECPMGFTGNHCESKVQRETEFAGSDEASENELGITSAMVVVSTLAVVVAVIASTTLVLGIYRRNQAIQSLMTVNLTPVSDPSDLEPDAVYRPSENPSKKINWAPGADLDDTEAIMPHYPLVDVGRQRDEDGNDLHDIELL